MRRERSNQQAWRSVLEIGPFQIALPEKYRGRATSAKRTAPCVMNNRAGDVDASMSSQSCTVREIDVLIHHKKIVVESAKLFKNLATYHERRSAGTEHLARHAAGSRRLSVKTLEGPACPQVAVAGAVDHRRIVEIDDSRTVVRPTVGSSSRGAFNVDPSALGHAVIVQKSEILGT